MEYRKKYIKYVNKLSRLNNKIGGHKKYSCNPDMNNVTMLKNICIHDIN